MRRNNRHHMTANQFYSFYKQHRSILSSDEFLSDYQLKSRLNAIEELHQEYLSYLFGDKGDCHFRDFLHLTGNFELMPMIEMLNGKGVSMYHTPRSYFSFNKEQLLAGCPNDESKMSYAEWKKRRKRLLPVNPPVSEIASIK